MLAKVKPENTIRFAWWGAEEEGLVGSTAYVDGQWQRGHRRHRHVHELRHGRLAELHLDRLRRVTSRTLRRPAGLAGRIEGDRGLYESYYTSCGSPYKDADFSGRERLRAFIPGVDIPSGGLFTGAEEPKTAAAAVDLGRHCGCAVDPCYHLACDTFAGTGSGRVEPHRKRPMRSRSTATSSRSRS